MEKSVAKNTYIADKLEQISKEYHLELGKAIPHRQRIKQPRLQAREFLLKYTESRDEIYKQGLLDEGNK